MTDMLETKNSTNKIGVIAALVIMCGVAFFLYNSQNLFSIKNTNVVLKPIKTINIENDLPIKIFPYSGQILSIYKDGLRTIDFDNKVTFELPFNLSNSIIQVCNNNFILIDIKNSRMFNYKDRTLKFKKSIDGKILGGNINESGYSWVFIKKDNQSNNFLIFDENGNKIVDYSYLNDECLVNADISEDNKYAGIVIILTRNGKLYSKIDYFELKNSQNIIPIYSIQKEDMLVSNIKISNKNDAVIVSDDKIECLNNFGKTRWKKEFKDLKVKKVYVSSRNYTIIEKGTLELLGVNSDITILDENGQEVGNTIKLHGKLTSIDTASKYPIISDQRKIYYINKDALWSYPINKSFKYVKCFCDQPKVLIINKREIEIFDII